MNNIQRKKNGTENIHVGIAEHVSVSQLLPSDLFREGYYYYKVGNRNTILGKLFNINVSNDRDETVSFFLCTSRDQDFT